MIMSNYVIWIFQSVPHACVLQNLVGFDDSNTLFHGTPLAKTFPSKVAFHMNPDFPTDLLLTDNLLNSDSCMVVSSKLADALRARNVSKLEYLPVSIVDHKGKVASKDYYILNPLELIDCIDRKKSKFRESRITPGRIAKFEKLVIDETRIPPDRSLFRMQGYPSIALASKALADDLIRGNFSGLGWLALNKYPED
ncbi:MAG: hypothetical protein AUH10_03720 [Gammaproteobacteria bacterium 13_2_20CM_66_19]|nr:MAG: hypothetical protein AUH10_03720 [Gammaproteobacteria bacterium 13_2_20CM_66_19]